VSGWVCPECGLDYDRIAALDTIAAVRSYPRRYREALFGFSDETSEDPDAVVRRRPDPSTWSALEYTAHVRDLLAWTAAAVRRLNREREPVVEGFDPDGRARADAYNAQDVTDVLDGMGEAAQQLANALGEVDANDWGRTGTFPWGERDILTTARNATHEGSHHLRDVERVLRAVIGRAPG
jgi:hypothetical protein